MKLTREEAIKLHKLMWMEMQEALGDDPSEEDREDFKQRWCFDHGFEIHNSCFLCEYVLQISPLVIDCRKCPFDWKCDDDSKYRCDCEEGKVTWCDSPISEILALEERKVDDE